MILRTHTEKRLLAQLGNVQPPAAVLERCADAERCAKLYRGILVRAALTIERGAVTMEALLGEALKRVPAPERALVHLDRFLEASMSPTGLLEHFIRAPGLLSDFLFLISSSLWLADTLVRDAGLFRWLLVSDVLDQAPSRAALRDAARAAVHRFERADLRANALRRFQRRELLRIAAADLLGRKPFSRVVAELSALADAVVACAFDEAAAAVERRKGRTPGARIAVIALGKLGGNELNYSSDIDLMFVYETTAIPPTAIPPTAIPPTAIPSTGSEATGGGVSVHEDVIAVVKEMLRILTDSSAEGMLYRTDLRLRPDGAAGALALSLDATMTYYERRGALWERQMLLRARVCAGDAALGAGFLRRVEPFVYPRTTLRPPSQLLADVHARLAQRWTTDRDVKHMRGGIRHIEFSLQALQMLQAKNPAVRTPSTLASIAAFAAEGLLAPEEEALLRSSYDFLRRIEHAVQVERFEQTHSLPEDETDMLRLAWMLGFDSAEALRLRIRKTRDDVVRICGAILGAKTDAEADELAFIPAGLAEEARSRELLHDLVFGRSSAPRSTADRHRLRNFLPGLLRDVADLPLPIQALAGIERFTHAAGARGGLTFLEHRHSRNLLLRLAALAPVALRNLERDPLALELVFSGWEEQGLEPQRLQLVSSTSALAGLLLGDIGMREYGRTLTRIADTVLARVLAQRHDDAYPFAVLALGKYGSEELIPGSDLDVILLFDSNDHVRHEHAQRLARDLIADMCGGAIPPLYEVDARLRPEGRSAPLVVSIDAWQRYLNERASLWERQSLLRARIAAGDEEFGRKIIAVIDGLRARHSLTRADVETVRTMRVRMEPENRFRQADFIDIKKSAGGLVDAEFAAQLLQLAMPKLRAGGTEEVLGDASAMLPEISAALARLRTHYAELRRMQLFLRLLVDTPSNLFPKDDGNRRLLAAAMQADDGRALLERLRDGMNDARRDFGIVLETVSSVIES